MVDLGLNSKENLLANVINKLNVLSVLSYEAPFFCDCLSVLPCSPPTYVLNLSFVWLYLSGKVVASSCRSQASFFIARRDRIFPYIHQSPELHGDWHVLNYVPASEAVLGPEECSALFGLGLSYIHLPDPFPMAYLALGQSEPPRGQSSSRFKVVSQRRKKKLRTEEIFSSKKIFILERHPQFPLHVTLCDTSEFQTQDLRPVEGPACLLS